MNSMFKDIRYGLRGFVAAPGFTVAAVVALGLGIGGNTAIFSVLYPLFLKPLAFPNPDQLVAVVPYKLATGEEGSVSFPDFRDWREQAGSLQGIVALRHDPVVLGSLAEPARVTAAFTTSNLFSVLGMKPMLGRTLEAGDDAPEAAPVLVLSHGTWARHFGSNPRVVGQDLMVNGRSFTIVGVMPEEFRMPQGRRSGPGAWAPLGQRPSPEFLEWRGHQDLLAFGRLKKGVELDQASAEMAAIAARLEQEHPDAGHVGVRIRLIPLQARVTREAKPVLLILCAAVGLVLLIACANVANLLLARASARTREFAIRLSLGASRLRLMRQLLTESVMLSLLGAAVGVLLSLWMVDGLKVLIGQRVDDAGVNGVALLFTLGVAVSTGLAFGLAPVAMAWRVPLHEALQDAGVRASASRRRLRLQHALISLQLGLAFALLGGAGLMIQSLAKLSKVDPGFEPRHLLTLRLSLPDWSYSTERKRVFYRQIFERAQRLPGVMTAGGGDPFPFEDGHSRTTVTIVGRPLPAPGEMLHPNMYEISPEYFETMGIPILEGRTFSESERASDVNRATIINRRFAQRMWPAESALGKRIRIGSGEDDPTLEVVGVVGDVRHGELDSEPPLQFYLPYEHSKWMTLNMVVRTAGRPENVVPALRRLVREADPALPASEPEMATSILQEATTNRRVTTLLLSAFAGLALLLATFGLYGLISYAVGQRRQELAIRIALGAQRKDILRLVLKNGFGLVAGGFALGLLLSLIGTRLLSALLYGVTASDPATYAVIALILGGAAMVASYVPARRATKTSPLMALRSDER